MADEIVFRATDDTDDRSKQLLRRVRSLAVRTFGPRVVDLPSFSGVET